MADRTRVVVTLAAQALAGLAAQVGADVEMVERPLLTFSPPSDRSELERVLARLADFKAVAFTSPRAAATFAECWQTGRGLAGDPTLPPLWATGPGTARHLTHLREVRQPSGPGIRGLGAGEALARAMIEAQVGSPVLYPCGEMHRDEFPEGLAAAGILVQPLVCYRAILATSDAARAASGEADILVVGSARVAGLLVEATISERRPGLVALGSTTGAVFRRGGWMPDAEAAEPTAELVGVCLRSLIEQRNRAAAGR